MTLMPWQGRGHGDARVDRDQRRTRSRVARTSAAVTSSSSPPRRPKSSRMAFGITTRPARSMVVFMVLTYHHNGCHSHPRVRALGWRQDDLRNGLGTVIPVDADQASI